MAVVINTDTGKLILKEIRFNIPAVVKTIEYDPIRTARIALLHYADGEKRYIIAPHGLKVGSKLLSGKGVVPNVGNALKLGEMPLGTTVHNIELRPGQGAKLARSCRHLCSTCLPATETM